MTDTFAFAPPRSHATPRPSASVVLRNVTRQFSGRIVLDNVSLEIPQGQFVALIGKSGSGKSTLLRAIAELDDDVEGSGAIVVPQNRSILFQDSRLLPWDRVLDNITLGLRLPDAARSGLAALADVGLDGRGQAWPNELSGGEQQRVALARSLVREPELLLADEPFGALDALTRIKMHELLFRLFQVRRPTMLLVTHDVDEALVLADRVLVMEQGRIVFDRLVDLTHTRRKTDRGFEDLRAALLGALGVVDAI